MGIRQGSLSGRGGEQCPEFYLPLSPACRYPFSPSLQLISPCHSTAATLRAHLASMETTALFPVNALRDPATLSLGPASWVRWKAVTRERWALYMSSRSSLLAREVKPTSKTFSACCLYGCFGGPPPEDVTSPCPLRNQASTQEMSM